MMYRKIPLILSAPLFSMATVLHSPVASADYSWMAGPIEAVSPEMACRGYVDWENATNPFRDRDEFIYSYISPSGTESFRCAYDVSGRGMIYEGSTTVYRRGDNCSYSKIYNAYTGICESPPADSGQSCSDQEGFSSGDPAIKQTDGTCRPLSKSPNQKGQTKADVCSISGSPIDFSSGNKLQRELWGTKVNPFREFNVFYNSIDGVWRHSFSNTLRVAAEIAVLTAEDGQESYFNLSNNIATSASVRSGLLERVADVWVYFDRSGNRLSFSYDGKLARIDYPSGQYQVITHARYFTSVKDSSGRVFSFTEDSLSQPLIYTADGLSVEFRYSVAGVLSSATSTYGDKVATRRYYYDDLRGRNLLTGITDERGQRYATWSYDAEGRAISSEHAGGADRVEVTYNDDGSSTVTNELGKKATYRFQTIQGIKRITAIEGEPSPNCPSSNSTFTYDDRGLLKTKTDNKGIVTTYDYNDRGLEVTRTEASGTAQARTVTTESVSYTHLTLPTTPYV